MNDTSHSQQHLANNKMAVKYKLTYFNVLYLAEPIRYLLNYGKLDYEDKLVQFSEWPKMKEELLFGKLPILEFGDVKVNQSLAICRYLAQVVGLAGKDDVENLKMDSLVHNIDDIRLNYALHFRAKDESVKEAIKKNVAEDVHPRNLKVLEEIVKRNNGYFFNGKLSWVDLVFASFAINADQFEKGVFDKYPNLKALWKKVEEIPQIAAYIAKRPQ